LLFSDQLGPTPQENSADVLGVDLLHPEAKEDDFEKELVQVVMLNQNEGSSLSVTEDDNFTFLTGSHRSTKPLIVLPEGQDPTVFK